MRFLFCLVLALVGAEAVRPANGKIKNKSLEELKGTLEKIRADLLSMKSNVHAVAGFVDGYVADRPIDPTQAVKDAFVQLEEKNFPDKCKQEAVYKMNEIKAAVAANCSALNIVEDAGSMTYNTIEFAALAMETMDDLLNGYQECSPWYKFWHYIPCVISYALSSYKELTGIITAAVAAWKENEVLAKDIAYQALCKTSQFTSQLAIRQVLDEAHSCSKNL